MILRLEQLAAAFLRRRGWVVFWLDPCARQCGPSVCWLELWKQQERWQREDDAREGDDTLRIMDDAGH